MKNLPGARMAGFFVLMIIVGFGVYAWAQKQGGFKRDHELVVIKFGWEGDKPGEREVTDLTPTQIKNAVGNDVKRYQIRSWSNDVVTASQDEGNLKPCHKLDSELPQTTAASATANEASPGGSPKGAKTQTTGAVSFTAVSDAQKFLDLLKTAADTASAGSAKKHK